MFQVQIQKPASRSTTVKAFVFLAEFAEFYYHNFTMTTSAVAWMNVALLGSIIGSINVTWSKCNVNTPDGEVPYGLLASNCFHCPNMLTVAPL